MPDDGRFHGPAGCFPGTVFGVYAGQAGALARVMTAGATRVPVSARPARGNVLAHLALRTRCRFRSMTVRYLASSLASAVQLVFPARIAAVTARRVRAWEISRAWTAIPARRPFRAGTAASAAARATPRVISVAAAQAASSCRTRPGDWERSIGPADGPAPRRPALASRSAVSDPSHRHLYRAARSAAGYSRQSIRSVTRHNISGTSWPSTVTQYSMTRTVTVTPLPDSSARYKPSCRTGEILFSGMSLFSRISTCVQATSRAIRAAP